jgi:F0F1-type ATP synthase membrane subunit b/b'
LLVWEYLLVADTLIDKVIALEKRAEEMVAEARAQAKRLEEEAARQLTEMQARHHADLDRERGELRAQADTRLKEALLAEDRRFAELSAEIRNRAEPQVGSAAEEVVGSFFASGEGQEAGHGH